ncbi:translin-associated factor X-interacting protein 1 isoform X2 [Egretta garzetta]|uniref:translin-associated factor X-interacting protein 1 isoform X2 n=1 Tax=Egretta garzetta TaxID=188379 RepID=UPI00163BF23E|nr:translin-associated factor X-interacting protein 1 isoform X2 [Egretta garzetta]
MVHVASICIHTDRPKGPQALLHPGGEAPEPYREIFEFFIDNFKTYKPLLSAIKNEYEVTLAHQKRTIRALQPLKATVTTISEECTRQMLALQEKEKDEINKLKQENRRLLKFIDNMKEEKNSLQTQVEHLRTSVAEEYARYLNEHSAHKLLLAKLNEIHNERLDMARHQLQDIKGEDVVKLTLALKMARQDLTTSQVKLNKMTADYGDVVPRRDFESLENKYSDLLREMKTLQKDLNQLRKDHEALLGIQAETTEEQDNLRAELQRVQRNRTPRPNWAKCSEVIPGGAERWGGLAKGKSSDQLVDVLLEEIGTRMLRERDIFPGWGKGDRVPVYLRHEGEVKNKKLTKKDAVNILKDVWKEKMAQEQQTGQRSSLPEFFLSYLQKKHGAAAAIEWSYTLYENMRLCRSNHILSSFYDILTGKVGEEQYHAQNRLVSSLQRELAACDISDSGSLTGEQFSTAVREAFPLKRKESIQELVDASRYKLDSTEDLIDYKSLFKESGHLDLVASDWDTGHQHTPVPPEWADLCRATGSSRSCPQLRGAAPGTTCLRGDFLDTFLYVEHEEDSTRAGRKHWGKRSLTLSAVTPPAMGWFDHRWLPVAYPAALSPPLLHRTGEAR